MADPAADEPGVEAPALPCGVQMSLGKGKVRDKVHSPMTITLAT